MDKVRLGGHRAFRTLAGLVEAVELEGIEESNVVRRDGVWFLTCSTRPAPAEPDEERIAMEAVMESVDPATWPGLTPAQRCALRRFAKPQPAEQPPALAKYQPCGCVVCTCEHETQCQGCGAHHCGTHPVGQFYGPVYQQPAQDVAALIRSRK